MKKRKNWYRVALDPQASFFIPYLCPVCGKKTKQPLLMDYENPESDLLDLLLRRKKAFWSFRFFCCHSRRTLKRAVFVLPGSERVRFYFREEGYAKAFARMNGKGTEEVSGQKLAEYQRDHSFFHRLKNLLFASFVLSQSLQKP